MKKTEVIHNLEKIKEYIDHLSLDDASSLLMSTIRDLKARAPFHSLTEAERAKLLEQQAEDIRDSPALYAEEILEQCSEDDLRRMLHPEENGDEETAAV